MERNIATTPIPTVKSLRRDEWRGLTSMKAGVIVPVAFFPLLREDSIRGRMAIQVKMEEALHTIVNPIRVNARAYLVPKLAMARFDGSVELFNRSFMGELAPGGGAAPAWDVLDSTIPQVDWDTGHPIYDALGVHYQPTLPISSDLLETYWTIVNWRRRATSKGLPDMPLTGTAFAPAFWQNQRLDHVKPSFDAAMMEGVVPVNLNAAQLPIPGIRRQNASNVAVEAGKYQSSSTQVTLSGQSVSASNIVFDLPDAAARLYAELGAADGYISLANIRLAKQTQVFAEMRQRYTGVPDEYLIDLLMRGINVPQEEFREPVLIGEGMAIIGQTQRFATDGASLDQSVTNGVAQLGLTINTPPVNPGGFVMVTMEIVPEQLYERIGDPAILKNTGGTADDLPNYLADLLDPQKVETVHNGYADIMHSTPAGIFGYAPLNHAWQRSYARVGGRYKRPIPDAFVEDRQRIWAVEKGDPTLSEDFYVCPQPFPHTVFADAEADPFEVIAVGQMVVRGLTVFGAGFEEDDDHYDKIMADVDTGRIISVPPTANVEAEVQSEVVEVIEEVEAGK